MGRAVILILSGTPSLHNKQLFGYCTIVLDFITLVGMAFNEKYLDKFAKYLMKRAQRVGCILRNVPQNNLKYSDFRPIRM